MCKTLSYEKVDEPPLESGANVIVAIKVEGGVVEGMSEVVEDNATEAWEVDKAAKAIVTGNMEEGVTGDKVLTLLLQGKWRMALLLPEQWRMVLWTAHLILLKLR